MAHILDDAVDLVTAEIAEISLHDGNPGDNGANEYEHGSYERQVPSYGSASGGSANITSNLEFEGEANAGPITHIGVWREGTPNSYWFTIVPSQERSFNSDGRLDVDNAIVALI